MSLPYTLPRDSTESSRLNEQHRVWVTNLGFLIHPQALAILPKDAHIGDIGTGTGAWILDPRQNSSYKYTGLDMSSAQFPKQHPQNVSFGELNVLEPIPKEHQGQYDLVHLRLLILGLSGKDWATAASNLLALLKPGGWLQWEEADFQRGEFLQNVPGASSDACEELVSACLDLNNRRGRMQDEPRRLTSIVAGAGFVDVKQDVFNSDRDAGTREGFTRAGSLAMEGTVKRILGEEGEVDGWTLQRFDRVMKEAKSELEGTRVFYRTNVHCVIGRKPS